MADWKKLAKALALADGKIDVKETEIIKREFYADGKLDRSELEFLYDLKKSAKTVVSTFSELVFAALKPVVLADGKIDAKEATWLRKLLFADKKIDEHEKKFLKDLKASAKSTSKEFDALYKECVG
jgi:uncharacterized tellurite resistance protein B-like protein